MPQYLQNIYTPQFTFSMLITHWRTWPGREQSCYFCPQPRPRMGPVWTPIWACGSGGERGARSHSILVSAPLGLLPSPSNHFCTQFCQPTGNGDSRGAKKMCFGLQFSVASAWTFFHCEAKFTKWLTIWRNTSWMVDDIAAEMCSMNPHSGERGVKILWCTFRRDSPSFFLKPIIHLIVVSCNIPGFAVWPLFTFCNNKKRKMDVRV